MSAVAAKRCSECGHISGGPYTPSEFAAMTVPRPSKPDTRPQEIRDAQTAMEAAVSEFDQVVDLYFTLKDEAGKRMSEEKKRVADEKVTAAVSLRDEIGSRLLAARVRYQTLVKQWSAFESQRVYELGLANRESERRSSGDGKLAGLKKGLLDRIGFKASTPVTE